MRNLLVLIFVACAVALVVFMKKPLAFEKKDQGPGTPLPHVTFNSDKPAPPQPTFWEVLHNGRTIREWHDRARDKDLIKTEREEAFRQLGLAGKAGAVALIELLGAADRDTVRPLDPQKWDPRAVMAGWVRMNAAVTLGRLGENGQFAASRLAELMRQDHEVNVRAACAVALANLGPRDPAVVQALKEVLRSKDFFVWHGAVCALSRVRPFDQETRDLLEKLAEVDPRTHSRNDHEWAAIMNTRMAAREALLKR